MPGAEAVINHRLPRQRRRQDSLRVKASASQNLSYRLPKHPLLMYISAVSRPNNVLKVQVTGRKPRTLIPAFRGNNDAEDPRSPMKASAPLRLFCFAVLFLFVRQLVFAQGAATGDLHVTVKDPKGNVVTNATVSVRDVAKGLERAGSSDGQGGYSVRQLAPGTYSVTVDASGFAKAEATGVAITVGEMAELPVTLTVAGGKEVSKSAPRLSWLRLRGAPLPTPSASAASTICQSTAATTSISRSRIRKSSATTRPTPGPRPPPASI